MIELVRSWLIGVTGVAILAALADSLSPEGAVKRVGRLTGGLVLMLAMLTPVLRVDVGDLLDATQWMGELAMAEQELSDARNTDLETMVAEQYSAYIVEKAATQGNVVTAFVTCAVEDNLIYPQSITVSGDLSEEEREMIAMWISLDLGVAIEDVFFEEEVM